MNQITIKRVSNSRHGTFGEMYYQGEKVCDTLEPANMDGNYQHAVNAGLYSLEFTYSPKFGCSLPLVNVPHRVGIRIHAGNNVSCTKGCILVGIKEGYGLIKSRVTLQIVLRLLRSKHIAHLEITSFINPQKTLEL